jgi:diacylglycerol kinase family enzyme
VIEVGTAIGGRRRIAAGVAVVAVGVLAVVLLVFLWRNLLAAVVALAGLVLSVAGGWWVVTERMPRRAMGVVGVGAGLLVVVAAVVSTIDGVDQIVLRLVAIVGLLAIAMLSARYALRRDADSVAAVSAVGAESAPPRHPVLVCNPWSGGGKVERFGLIALAHQLGVEVVVLERGLDLEQLALDAIGRGADCLGMAGGDGSQALVASIAIEYGLPFVCVSAGTRNHFALDLGLDRDDPRGSRRAFNDAVERRIDYATVNGRLFVNNVSLGVYATVVQQDAYRDDKAGTTKALLPELLGRQAEPFDLQFTTPNGDEVDGAFLIEVSNNPYVTGVSLDAAQRHRMDTGTLGVVAVSTPTGGEAAKLMALSIAGQRRRSQYWHEFVTTSFEIRSRSGSAFVGVDGEALEMRTPLRFESHHLGLRLLVPAENSAAAEVRRAREARVSDLVAVMRGIEPAAAADAASTGAD